MYYQQNWDNWNNCIIWFSGFRTKTIEARVEKNIRTTELKVLVSNLIPLVSMLQLIGIGLEGHYNIKSLNNCFCIIQTFVVLQFRLFLYLFINF